MIDNAQLIAAGCPEDSTQLFSNFFGPFFSAFFPTFLCFFLQLPYASIKFPDRLIRLWNVLSIEACRAMFMFFLSLSDEVEAMGAWGPTM